MTTRHNRLAALTLLAAALLATPARAEDSYKMGMSVGLTGYAATVDRAWRDGASLAVDALNANGGILGHKIELTIEDNHFRAAGRRYRLPQDAELGRRPGLRQRLRLGRQFRRGAFAGPRPGADDAVLDPANPAGAGEMGL